MTAKALMLQGTGSDVGKSVLTAGLCRIARRRGIKVAPFKPQNMSNNAAACPSGGEIGRAQALQALACGLEPHVDMNPVLLKPQTDKTAQVVVHGKAHRPAEAAEYMANRGRLLPDVLTSFYRLCAGYDMVIVEGAGSPAETNLRRGDIANMGFAEAADVPVCLIGDIEKGGVIASLVGTKAVMTDADATRIKGFIINKFRGDPRLFDAGLLDIEQRTGWCSFGVVPWLPATAHLPAEDAVVLAKQQSAGHGALKVYAPVLSRMANFDDAVPLKLEPGITFRWVPPGKAIPRDADVVILFGTKSTLGDLAFLRAQGWHHDIMAHARAGGRVLGLCGGYQMLGKTICDPHGVDGPIGDATGLGLLDVTTIMTQDKTVQPVAGTCALSGENVAGYEIHMGETAGPDAQRSMVMLEDKPCGARSPDGRIEGTYVHGLFSADPYRRAWVARAGGQTDVHFDYSNSVETALDALADGLEAALDIDALFACARSPKDLAAA
ncbi:MAG: cobyric acid synthase [Pseudomonadota bacterium]